MNDLNSVFFVNADTGYIVGKGKIFLKTTDGGNTWNNKVLEFVSDNNYSFNSVFFTNTTTGYIVGQGGLILKTTDGGTSWSWISSPTYLSLQSVFFPDANTGYAVGGDYNSKSVIIKTFDAGLSWTVQTDKIITGLLKSVYFTNANTGYVAGTNGTILKTTDGGTFSIREFPHQEACCKIFPNPANSKITIKREKNMHEKTLVCIFTITGEVVYKDNFATQNEIEIDVSSLLKGIYVVKLQDGNEIETKKLVIQ